ncbi:hypothetical protein [Homoserinimonas hongtaonis]|uniref:hypothetical protein n=1 Tax=Homoserinimonas hongtaonis TaxID=2079791 RepID=UPI00131EEEA8|nr:hypothetical protein [Salinibacterium hongtaonis]
MVEANPVISVFAPVDGVIEMRPNTATTLLAGAAIGSAGGVEIVVPADGMLIEQLRKTGDSVAANTPIASVAYSGHGVRIVVPPEQLFRLYQEPVYGKVNIIAGPAGLDCVLAPAVTVAADEPAGVICLLPREAEVVPGLSAKVGINTGQRDSVVALPVSAVSGSSNQGEVTIVRGNERIRTSVTLGISDGAFIEILEGVAVGDKVLSFAPKLG